MRGHRFGNVLARRAAALLLGLQLSATMGVPALDARLGAAGHDAVAGVVSGQPDQDAAGHGHALCPLCTLISISAAPGALLADVAVSAPDLRETPPQAAADVSLTPRAALGARGPPSHA